jgi:hypothetical protein
VVLVEYTTKVILQHGQTVSDERIKKNITDNNIGLEAINKIQVRNFEYRTEDEIS